MDKDDLFAGIDPGKFYRIESAEKRAIIPLTPSATNEAIKRGDLPKPIKLTENGRAAGWLGSQLIEHFKKRIEAAQKPQPDQPQPSDTSKLTDEAAALEPSSQNPRGR